MPGFRQEPGIAERWRAIADALRGYSVDVIGVTKFQPVEKVIAAIRGGVRELGVNYLQEGDALRAALAASRDLPPVRWHFIGHIQSRKAPKLVDFDLVQSIERAEVAEKLARRAAEVGKCVDVLLEVNIGGEGSKSGVTPTNLDGLLEIVAQLPALRVRGLMAMPPPLEPVDARAPFFVEMRRLFEARRSTTFDTLSMGTSEDYPIAVREGSTQVRLGTVLFGART